MDFDELLYSIRSFAYQSIDIVADLSHAYFVLVVSILSTVLVLIGVSPLHSNSLTTSAQMVCLVIRKVILYLSFTILLVPLLMCGLVVIVNKDHNLWFVFETSITFYLSLVQEQWYIPVVLLVTAIALRITWFRFAAPALSAFLRRSRKLQKTDLPSDIREELEIYKQKDFLPSDHYSDQGIFIGLDEQDQPDYIPIDTWHEVSMQLIGPSRYGKGVLLGCVMDQIIRKGDGLVYIDPKADKWAPHVMYQAAQQMGRKFYYLALHDEGPGYWAPFDNGSKREAFTRLCMAFGLEYTKESGTDFYKSQETAELESALKVSRSIQGLAACLEGNERTLRINAELKRWSEIRSLCPSKNKDIFSIEQAIKENAVVYLQGSLDDPVITTATKVFISEYVQTARRLFHRQERPAHLTMVVDEVSFLVSEILAKALATNLGFNVNFVLAYQSPGDLLNIDDKTANPRYLAQSITSNSQVKITYGGTDKDSAELVSKLSGTVTKTMLRGESTDVDDFTGGETWKPGRFVAQQEVPLIHANTMYALPPRVCAVFQPRSLAQIRYTSHVPVNDLGELSRYLKDYAQYVDPDEISVLSFDEQEAIKQFRHTQKASEEKSKLTRKPKQKNPSDSLVQGIVKSFGAAPYKHDSENSKSFYVDLDLDAGQSKTIWSIGLNASFTELCVAIGDRIEMTHLGKTPIDIETSKKRNDGSLQKQTVQAYRNAWRVKILEKSDTQVLMSKRRDRKNRQKQQKESI